MKVRLRSFSDLKKAKLQGRTKFAGMDISIEHKKGSTRKWDNGSTKMHFDYGYIRRTEGTDGDHVDVYLGPDKDSERVFIVNQKKAPDFQVFDEQKVMLGFKDPKSAKAAYLKQYNDERFFGSMIAMRLKDFKERVFHPDQKGIAIQKSGKVMILPPVVLMKADKPPKGWIKVGKKGGYKSPNKVNGKHIYWYPGQPHPAAAQTKKKRRKPSPVRDPAPKGATAGEPMQKFEASRAEPGTGVYKMENGVFLWKTSRTYDKSVDGHQMQRTQLKPAVDSETKMQLIAEFRPLMIAESKKARRLFALKDRYEFGPGGGAKNETQSDLMSAGMEGMLKAIESYKADTPFAQHAKIYVRDHIRLHAAAKFAGGVTLPERHARNLARYIAARAQARKALEIDDPSPKDVLPYFDLRKKHLHPGLPAKDSKGRELRNAQLPDTESYELGFGRAAASRGRGEDAPKVEGMREVTKQPSKLEWAEMYHGFLSGQKGVDVFDEEVIFPSADGAGIGYGYDPHEQVEIREQVIRAVRKLEQLDKPKTISHQLSGTKKAAEFRVDSVGELLLRRLGVGHEPHSARALADEIPVYKKKKDGTEKAVGKRNAIELLQVFVDKGLKDLKETMEDKRGKRLLERAHEAIVPPNVVPEGPSYHELLAQEAKQIPSGAVAAWKKQMKAKTKLKRRKAHIDSMSMEEARLEMAKQTRRGRRATKEMRKLATMTTDVERIDRHYGVAYMYDPATKQRKAVKVRMTYDKDFSLTKSNGTPVVTDRMIHQAREFPELMTLLTEDSEVPSSHRTEVQRMLGWY